MELSEKSNIMDTNWLAIYWSYKEIFMKKFVTTIVFLSVSVSISAYDKVEKMNITNIAVSNRSDTFVAYVDRHIPDSICEENNRFKFDIEDSATSIVVALLTSAFVAKKPVQFYYDKGVEHCLKKGQSAGFVKVFDD